MTTGAGTEPQSFTDELAPPPPVGEGFETGWTVRTADVDPDNRLRFDGIARYSSPSCH